MRYEGRMRERQTGDAAVTGVAKGSLGTDTALEDTQLWDVPAAAAAPPAIEPAQSVDPSPSLAPVTASRPTNRRRIGSPVGFASSPRAAGLAVVVLLALVGVTAIVTSQDRAGAGSENPPAQATSAPTDAPPADGGGERGGGKDKDKDGKGNGKGHGNGNGNGNR